MKIEHLLEIVVCPSCKKGELILEAADDLVCQRCGYHYGIVDGVPHLLTKGSTDNLKRFLEGLNRGPDAKPSAKGAKGGFLRYVEPPARVDFGDNREKKLREVWNMISDRKEPRENHHPLVLVIGNLRMKRNTAAERETVSKYEEEALRMDVCAKPGVDFVGDGYELPFADGSLDLVVAQATMKHLSDPNAFIKEVERVLRRNGLFYAEFAYLLSFHRWPGDYLRFTPLGILELIRDFEIVETGINRGPSYTVADILTLYFGCLLSFNNAHVYSIFRRFFGWIFHPLKYLDVFLAGNSKADLISQVNYCIAKKS